MIAIDLDRTLAGDFAEHVDAVAIPAREMQFVAGLQARIACRPFAGQQRGEVDAIRRALAYQHGTASAGQLGEAAA